MALTAAAAYETVSSDFALDMLQCHFLIGPQAKTPMQLHVQRLNDGGRFATRAVALKQKDSICVYVTCSFVRANKLTGPSMQHTIQRTTPKTVDSIEIDDLAENRSDVGPWMAFERLSLTHKGPSNAPENMTHTVAATINTPISSSDPKIHTLGILCLSDYHVVSCPPIAHGLSIGQPAMGDASHTETERKLERFTSLNHTIHFNLHEAFRADDMCHIEAQTPWSSKRRGYIQTKIFTKDARLIATCVQEGYYVLKDDRNGPKL